MTSTSEVLSAISAISSTSEAAKPMTAGLLVSHADSVLLSRFLLSRRNKRNKGNLCSDARSLSAISAISAGRLLPHADSSLLSRKNKGNKGNLLAPSAKLFLLFLLFLRDIIISYGQ